MRLIVASCVAVVGCNQVFGIKEGQVVDAPPTKQLIVPAPPSPCSPTLPAFGSWTYARKVFSGYPDPDNTIQTASFYGTDRAYVGDDRRVFDSAPDGTVTAIPQLSPTDGTQINAFATDPRGDVIWFERGGLVGPTGNQHYFGATYYATRAQSWEIHGAELSLAGPPVIAWPRSVAFYAGTIRMTVSVEDTLTSGFRVVELRSTDGYQWTDTHTLDRFANASGAYVVADGCIVIIQRDDPNTTHPKLYAAARDDTTGEFSAEIKLATDPDQPLYSENPALDASKTHLWYFHSFRDVPCCDRSMMEGHPP